MQSFYFTLIIVSYPQVSSWNILATNPRTMSLDLTLVTFHAFPVRGGRFHSHTSAAMGSGQFSEAHGGSLPWAAPVSPVPGGWVSPCLRFAHRSSTVYKQPEPLQCLGAHRNSTLGMLPVLSFPSATPIELFHEPGPSASGMICLPSGNFYYPSPIYIF